MSSSVLSTLLMSPIIFASNTPSWTGTAFPICLYCLEIAPLKINSSGKPWIRAHSRTVRFLVLLGWISPPIQVMVLLTLSQSKRRCPQNFLISILFLKEWCWMVGSCSTGKSPIASRKVLVHHSQEYRQSCEYPYREVWIWSCARRSHKLDHQNH